MRARTWGGLITSVVVVALLAWSASAASASTAKTSTTGGAASTTQVLSAVSAAAHLSSVPGNLDPSLSNFQSDVGYDQLGGCLTTATASQQNVSEVVGTKVPTLSDCVFGDPGGTHTLVLYGDSHAQMWLPSFSEIGKRLHWKVILLAKVSCGAPQGSYYPGEVTGEYAACDQFHHWALSAINRMDPSIVVLTSLAVPGAMGPNATPAEWGSDLDKTLGLITSRGTEKVVLGDIPYLTANGVSSGPTPVDCLAAHESAIQSCSLAASSAVVTSYHAAEQSAATSKGASYINVVPWFCSTVCTAVIGKYLVYINTQHITATYADYLSGVLQGALEPEIVKAHAH